MKWPETLTLVRHDKSVYNAAKSARQSDPLYQQFKKTFDQDPFSQTTHQLAQELRKTNKPGSGDHNMPLAAGEGHQAQTMAQKLKLLIKLPDLIFVSPYERTLHTLAKMQEGWPELKDAKTVEEGRIREQEHGMALLYGDWRIFQALHPEQRELQELEDSYYYRYPQGENVEDVRARVRSWLNTLTRDFVGQNVLAVTHHLTILAVRANLERLSAAQFLELDTNNKPINAGVTIYRGNPDLGKDGKLVLDQYNVKLY